MMTSGVQSTRHYSTIPPRSANLVSTKALFVLASLWMKNYVAAAQPTFLQALGGTGFDEALAITASESEIVVGGRSSGFGAGASDALLAKWWNNGTFAWAKSFGGIGDDYILSLTTTSAGEIIAAGYTQNFGAGVIDILLLQLSSDGVLQSATTFGGVGAERALALKRTSDGGIVVAGVTNSFGAGNFDAFLMKLRNNGMLDWAKTYGRAGEDQANALTITSDGGIVVGGFTIDFDQSYRDVLLWKYSDTGTIVWVKTFGDPYDDDVQALTTTSDEAIIAVGNTQNLGANSYDVLLLKVLDDGTLVWVKTFGGGSVDFATGVEPSSDGGFIVAGYLSSFGAGSYDVFYMKMLSNGTLTEAQTIGGGNNDKAYSFTATPDGLFAAAGFTDSIGAGSQDILLTKFSVDDEQTITCPPKQNITQTLFDITSLVNVTTLPLVEQDWGNLTSMNWSTIIDASINPLLSEQCYEVSTTGLATTGLITTGNATTGVGTTGNMTTGLLTTGSLTTGIATTGVTTGLPPSETESPSTTISESAISSSNKAPSLFGRNDQLPLILGLVGGGILTAAGCLGALCLIKHRRTKSRAQEGLELKGIPAKTEVFSGSATHYESMPPTLSSTGSTGGYASINVVVTTGASLEGPYALIGDVAK